jgi:hypothetical protein
VEFYLISTWSDLSGFLAILGYVIHIASILSLDIYNMLLVHADLLGTLGGFRQFLICPNADSHSFSMDKMTNRDGSELPNMV